MKKIIISIVFFTLLIAPITVYAQLGAATGKLQQVAGGTGLQGDLTITVSSVITAALSLVGTIFLVLTVYAGILWMTASGNEEQVTKAKNIVTQAIIGLAITLGAYAITAFVTGKLSGGGGSDTITTSAVCISTGDAQACYDKCEGADHPQQVGTCGDTPKTPVCCK